jgi:hypothetical protein
MEPEGLLPCSLETATGLAFDSEALYAHFTVLTSLQTSILLY